MCDQDQAALSGQPDSREFQKDKLRLNEPQQTCLKKNKVLLSWPAKAAVAQERTAAQ